MCRRPTLLEQLEARFLLTTYYVATTGSNNANGTSSSTPLATLQAAADRVVAGDTVNVAAGNYVGFDLRTSGTANARITFKAAAGAVIDRVNTKTNRDGINLENCSYVTIDGFTLVGTNDPATSRAGIRVVGDGFDTGVFSQGVIVQNNSADRWGYWGIFTAFADDIIIQNNVCSRSAKEHGIYFSNSADRPVIRNNTSWGNAACGIHMNADIFTGNTDLPNVDGMITGALVDGNTCYANGAGSAFSAGGGSAINCDGVRNSRIVNNLLYDNHAGGITLYQIDAAGPALGNTIANNTVIQANNARWCLNITDGAINTTVFNNIFYNLHSFRGSIELSADSAAGFASDYNITDGRFSFDDTIQTLSQWRTSRGGDTHSRALASAEMPPLFMNYAAGDFTLSPNSSAVDAGVASFNAIAAPTTDRTGASRPKGAATDIGAYERSPFASVINGQLMITGTPGVDAIEISLANNNYTIKRNGETQFVAASTVVGIQISAGDGDDMIVLTGTQIGAYVDAGTGNDYIQGGDGPDIITAGAGKDRAFGGLGDDRLNGNGGHDKLFGEPGKDRLYGGNENDTLDGGSSGDRLYGDAGNNFLYGQGGDDYFYTRNSAVDQLFGGAGYNRAQVDTTLDTRAAITELLP